MMKTISKNKMSKNTIGLIVLCWIVYTCSYLGKLGYNANITMIEEAYSVSHSTAGMVSTFFFFAYGIGQIINGIFCKKYPLRLMVFIALICSGLMNLLVATTSDFLFVKYFWLINGAALSILWPSLIRLLSETLNEKDIGSAVVAMGTTVAVGTFFVYGLSALFVALGSYLIMFFVAGFLLLIIAIIWFSLFPRLTKDTGKKQKANETVEGEKKEGFHGLWFSIIALAIFAVANNLIKDGLTTWVPMILKELYDTPDYLSILLTMILPILAILGTGVAVMLHKKIKDLVLLSATFFLLSAIFIGVVILCLPTGLLLITLGSFGLVSCVMASVNNIVTSMAPLYWKGRGNSGLLAGVLNGFCYLGSTLSSYGLGAIADFGGWNAVFLTLFVLCMIVLLIGLVYFFVKRKRLLSIGVEGKEIGELDERIAFDL